MAGKHEAVGLNGSRCAGPSEIRTKSRSDIDKVSFAGRWGEGGELQAVDVIGSENQE